MMYKHLVAGISKIHHLCVFILSLWYSEAFWCNIIVAFFPFFVAGGESSKRLWGACPGLVSPCFLLRSFMKIGCFTNIRCTPARLLSLSYVLFVLVTFYNPLKLIHHTSNFFHYFHVCHSDLQEMILDIQYSNCSGYHKCGIQTASEPSIPSLLIVFPAHLFAEIKV